MFDSWDEEDEELMGGTSSKKKGRKKSETSANLDQFFELKNLYPYHIVMV